MLSPLMQRVSGRIGGKGRKIPIASPGKLCSVCAKAFAWSNTPVQVPSSEPCKECAEKLKDGCVALVCADEYAFVKSERLKDLAGKIIVIQPVNFQKIKAQFNAEWRKQEDAP